MSAVAVVLVVLPTAVAHPAPIVVLNPPYSAPATVAYGTGWVPVNGSSSWRNGSCGNATGGFLGTPRFTNRTGVGALAMYSRVVRVNSTACPTGGWGDPAEASFTLGSLNVSVPASGTYKLREVWRLSVSGFAIVNCTGSKLNCYAQYGVYPEGQITGPGLSRSIPPAEKSSRSGVFGSVYIYSATTHIAWLNVSGAVVWAYAVVSLLANRTYQLTASLECYAQVVGERTGETGFAAMHLRFAKLSKVVVS